MAKGYLIGDAFKDKIKSTIARVDGMIDGRDVTKIETRFESMQVAPGQPVRVAAFPRTVSWSKGQTQQITFYTHTGTAFGLATTGAEGTATAVSLCNGFASMPPGVDDPKIGPTPTMTWCLVSKSKGGANVAIEGPQSPVRLAAYKITDGPWEKGSPRQVAFYAVSGSAVVATGETATASNVSMTYYPLATAANGTAVGPTPTMAWCVLGNSPDGTLLAVEAEEEPVTRLATITPQAIGELWERGSARIVKITGSTQTVNVFSTFDYYSPLDLDKGLFYTKSISPAGGGETANVVIGTPPVPLHAARYTQSGSWQKDAVRTLQVLPSAGITQTRTIPVLNPYYDSIEPTDKPMAIGKIGTAYHVITPPEQAGVTLGTRTEFGDKDTPWDKGSQRTVKITGTTTEVQVYNVFDHYTNVDTPHGLAFIKGKEPGSTSNTAYLMISPPPVPMHKVTTTGTPSGVWARNQENAMIVSPGTNVINVSNPYFDDFDIDDRPLAAGKFGTAFHLITAPPVPGVRFGTRTDFGDKDTPWQRNSQRTVKITGTTTEVQVYSEFDTYTHLDTPHGLAFAKTKDDAGNTAYSMISPAPIPLHLATATAAGSWLRGQTKTLTVPPSSGVTATRTVDVLNRYFDSVQIDQNPMAIGKFGPEYHLLTAPSQPSVLFATRANAGTWARGAVSGIRIQGSTTDVTAYNFIGDYEAFDGQLGDPSVCVAKGSIPNSQNTAYYVIAPPPLVSRKGTFSGEWQKGSQKSITLSSEPTGTLTVTNEFATVGSTSSSTSKKCAILKDGTAWFLVAAEC